MMGHALTFDTANLAEYSIQAIHLEKRFGDFLAVRDLSFDVRVAETVAFLGPNGAGKSTTIKILCGILSPNQGSAKILGHPSGTRMANQKLGLVFGTRSQLYLHMTVKQSLELLAEIYGVSGSAKFRRIDEVADLFDARPLLNQRTRTLSLGERMRCEIMGALLHKPRILLADEPTIGLDIIAKNKLRNLILNWQKTEKTTLLLTSHDLSDVEALCDRAILIDHGQLKFDGPIKNLMGDLSTIRRIRVTTTDPLIQPVTSDSRLIRRSDDHSYEFRTNQIPMHDAISIISKHYGDRLHDLSVSEVSLEEVIAHRYA